MSKKGKTMKNNNSKKVRELYKGNFITLRGRKGVKGESLYLDYYITENDKKVRKYEFLSKLALLNSLTPEKRKENLQTAIAIAQTKDNLLKAGEYDQVTEITSKTDFIIFFEKYISEYKKNDLKMIKASFNHFKAFLQSKKIESIKGKDIKESLIFDFKEYLINNKSFKGETASSYFKRFKKVLKDAQRKKIVKGDPAKDIFIKSKKDTLTKDVLDFNELNRLYQTPCKNELIKRAFLFSAMTGVRYVDVRLLKWKNISNGVLKFIQEKTNIEQIINLNKTALEMAGTPGEPESKIFDLPSHSYCLRILKQWKNDAGITKHVTWHVSRHSFATNLLLNGTDIKTTAGLLGHSDLSHVNKYVRFVQQYGEKAVNKIEL